MRAYIVRGASAAALFTGLSAVPMVAADANPSGVVDVVTMEQRPGEPVSRRTKTIAVSDLPDERRSVLMIYQGDAATMPAIDGRP